MSQPDPPPFKQMRIAISCAFSNSFFSSGVPQATYALAAGFKGIGHHVDLIQITEAAWYDDCAGLRGEFPIVPYTEFAIAAVANPYDVFIDVEGGIFPERKRPYARHVATFFHRIPFVAEMEQILFASKTTLRSMDGVDSILTWSIYNSQDAQLYEAMYKKPVIFVPYNWFHKPVSTYIAESRIPPWSKGSGEHWTCHVVETNQTMSSSAVLPMVITAQLSEKKILPMKECIIHNSQTIKDNEFFKKNVHDHCTVEGLTYQYVGRQRVADWRMGERNFVLAHNRFTIIKAVLLDLVWAGIPVIHNSPWLRDLGCGLEEFYYADNDIDGACAAARRMAEAFKEERGFFAVGALVERQKAMLRSLYYREEVLLAWGEACAKLAVGPGPILVPVQGPVDEVLRVGFSDMWDQFNPSYNFFTLLLEAACANKPRIVGVDCGTGAPTVDILIFGPFGDRWKSAAFKNIPKVHYTGENTEPVKDPSVFLNLGYKQIRGDDAGYVRLPLWMLEIDWFGADAERIRNPKPLPLSSVMSVDPAVLEAKDRFCAFVVTNPRNQARNDAFHWLTKYKRVDSAGRLFNNVGPEIYAGLGGGGGELKKHAFLQKYRFCLTYENEMCEGYTTEKILHAKAAGCVPIYWGDPLVDRDFNAAGFLNASSVRTEEDLIALVQAVDADPEAWRRMAAVPALDPYRRDLVRRRLSHIATIMLSKLGYKTESVPRFLGSAEGGTIGNVDSVVHYVSYASAAVLDNLHRFLGSLTAQATIFLAPDVVESAVALLRERFPAHIYIPLQADAVSIEGFDDFWTPRHYAWKPYILHRINHDNTYSGKLIVYLDCGAVVVRQPTAWLAEARAHGVALLEDPRQVNRTWCHGEFCRALEVSNAELGEKQIWAGSMAFVAGSSAAVAFFDEGWRWAQQRAVIVGEKWLRNGIGVDGVAGHRHDQSIYSIVRLRQGVPVHPLDTVYCDHSRGLTDRIGAAFYVHRGGYVEERQIFPAIDDACIINLRRRADRLEKFRATHSWSHRVRVQEAVDGRGLTLTPALATLFKPNDFHWKKAVMGCALSHLDVWKKVAESTIGDNCLVLEDDVRFDADFLECWSAAAASIPADYDILYLGGVLPPNKTMFGQVLEPVAPHWSRIKEHTLFGQRTPNRYFHFCNYAYIIRKSAAQKLLASIKARGGYHTSADHMICNEVGMFKHYVLTPLAAGCYQDDDPKYASSQFNDFSRVDGFDSDLWNNDERFDAETVRTCLEGSTPIVVPMSRSTRFYTAGPHKLTKADLLEHSWLQYLMDGEKKPKDIGTAYEHARGVDFQIEYMEEVEPQDGCPVFIVQRPHVEHYRELFRRYDAVGKSFKVIHLSDEYGTDPVDWVGLGACKGVLRNYPRVDLSGVKKVATVPLGWARSSRVCEGPWQQTPGLPFREVVWSFYGTRWANREAALEPLRGVGPNECVFYKDWKDAAQLSATMYLGRMLNSMFVACPGGQHPETFRLYEALECGAIPLVVRKEGDGPWVDMMKEHIPLLDIQTWEQAAGLVAHLLEHKELMEKYRLAVLLGWTKLRAVARVAMQSFLGA
jgi:alpha(1,3/1,4) fucosyltransferase